MSQEMPFSTVTGDVPIDVPGLGRISLVSEGSTAYSTQIRAHLQRSPAPYDYRDVALFSLRTTQDFSLEWGLTDPAYGARSPTMALPEVQMAVIDLLNQLPERDPVTYAFHAKSAVDMECNRDGTWRNVVPTIPPQRIEGLNAISDALGEWLNAGEKRPIRDVMADACGRAREVSVRCLPGADLDPGALNRGAIFYAEGENGRALACRGLRIEGDVLHAEVINGLWRVGFNRVTGQAVEHGTDPQALPGVLSARIAYTGSFPWMRSSSRLPGIDANDCIEHAQAAIRAKAQAARGHGR